jgi:hypothetical protein
LLQRLRIFFSLLDLEEVWLGDLSAFFLSLKLGWGERLCEMTGQQSLDFFPGLKAGFTLWIYRYERRTRTSEAVIYA